MPRIVVSTVVTVMTAALTLTAAQADPGPLPPGYAPAVWGQAGYMPPYEPAKVKGRSGQAFNRTFLSSHSQFLGPVAPAAYAGPGYPYLDAPLFPTPRPDIPYQTGVTLITNQAFAPHEMLYPHKYRALYPPFYYANRGAWVVTPFGVWSKERWELQGTEVKVKYKPHISPFALFHPPVHR